MHGLKVEYRRPESKSLSWDLANNLAKRSLYGKVAVVTDKPAAMLASVRKQWLRVVHKTQIEYARRLESGRTPELLNQLAHVRNVTFTAKAPEDMLEADVTFGMVDNFIRYAPDCSTMYITCELSKEDLYLITAWMLKRGLIVIYA